MSTLSNPQKEHSIGVAFAVMGDQIELKIGSLTVGKEDLRLGKEPGFQLVEERIQLSQLQG